MASVFAVSNRTALFSAHLRLALAHPSSLAITSSRSTPSAIQVTSSTKEIPQQSSIWLSTAWWISAMYRAKRMVNCVIYYL